MRIVELDPELWYRGFGSTWSRLVGKVDGRMCCVGFDGVARGIPQGVLRGFGLPSNLGDADVLSPGVEQYIQDWGTLIHVADLTAESQKALLSLHICSESCYSLQLLAARINDSALLEPDVRFRVLRELFAFIGVDLRMKGESCES